MSTVPVSYTHLDVYKRQIKESIVSWRGVKWCRFNKILEITLINVVFIKVPYVQD